MKSSQKKQVAKVAALSVLAAGVVSCGHQDLVACHGLKTNDGAPYVVMSAGLCGKLAGGQAQPLPTNAVIPKTNNNDYVMCYGVAAPGKNDCGTKTTACAGTVEQAKSQQGWVAVLEGVCKQIGGRVGAIKEK